MAVEVGSGNENRIAPFEQVDSRAVVLTFFEVIGDSKGFIFANIGYFGFFLS